MSEHRHQQITPGCYRCDLNLDELRDFLRDQFALGGTSGSDPLYDDVHEAWEAFDGSMEQLLAAEKAKWQAEMVADLRAKFGVTNRAADYLARKGSDDDR